MLLHSHVYPSYTASCLQVLKGWKA